MTLKKKISVECENSILKLLNVMHFLIDSCHNKVYCCAPQDFSSEQGQSTVRENVYSNCWIPLNIFGHMLLLYYGSRSNPDIMGLQVPVDSRY